MGYMFYRQNTQNIESRNKEGGFFEDGLLKRFLKNLPSCFFLIFRYTERTKREEETDEKTRVFLDVSGAGSLWAVTVSEGSATG